MPAPRPSITAITAANDGQAERRRQRRPAGSGPPRRRAARRSASRPSPHPERNSSVSSTIAMSTPMSSPTGAVLLGRQVDQDAARLDLDLPARRSRRPRSAPRRPPSSTPRGSWSSARRPPPGARPSRPGRPAANGLAASSTPSSSRTFASAPSIAALGPGSETLPSSTVKTSVESTPAERRRVRLEEVDRLLGLGARERSSRRRACSLAPAARTSSTRTPTAAARLRFQCEDRVRARRARSWDMLVPFERGSTERVRAIPPGQWGNAEFYGDSISGVRTSSGARSSASLATPRAPRLPARSSR